MALARSKFLSCRFSYFILPSGDFRCRGDDWLRGLHDWLFHWITSSILWGILCGFWDDVGGKLRTPEPKIVAIPNFIYCYHWRLRENTDFFGILKLLFSIVKLTLMKDRRRSAMVIIDKNIMPSNSSRFRKVERQRLFSGGWWGDLGK